MLSKMTDKRERRALCKPLFNCILFLSIYCCCVYRANCCVVKTCDATGTFQQMFGITLPMCAEECFRRQRCEIFMFHFGMKHCALKDASFSLQSLGEEDPVCRYYTRDDWSQIDLGPCNGHTCSDTERCTSKTDDKFECVKSECPTPDEVANATILSNTHSIGAKNRYKCNNGFFGHGTPTIICGDEASWSVTDFQCDIEPESCPAPAAQYDNAELTHVDGDPYRPGTILTFTCREGYRTMGVEWKSECQSDLLWEPAHIRCCPDNTTHTSYDFCYAIINAGKASTMKGAEDYCKRIGGWPSWTYSDMKDLYDRTTTDWALQFAELQWIDENWNYTNCAAENDVRGNDSKSLQEKIVDVVENEWKGGDCFWGWIWAAGQPGAVSEGCLVIDLNDDNTYGVHVFSSTDFVMDKVGFACQFDTPWI